MLPFLNGLELSCHGSALLGQASQKYLRLDCIHIRPVKTCTVYSVQHMWWQVPASNVCHITPLSPCRLALWHSGTRHGGMQ